MPTGPTFIQYGNEHPSSFPSSFWFKKKKKLFYDTPYLWNKSTADVLAFCLLFDVRRDDQINRESVVCLCVCVCVWLIEAKKRVFFCLLRTSFWCVGPAIRCRWTVRIWTSPTSQLKRTAEPTKRQRAPWNSELRIRSGGSTSLLFVIITIIIYSELGKNPVKPCYHLQNPVEPSYKLQNPVITQ